MIPYKYLSMNDAPASKYWDQTLLSDILKDSRFHESDLGEGSIIIMPGAHQSSRIEQINNELSKLKWVVLIITSDEEGKFPIDSINHPNIRIYVQYPKRKHDKYGKMPIGYGPGTRENVVVVDKDVDFFFAGQVMNSRRKAAYEAMKLIENKNCEVFPTEGFAQGMEKPEYMHYMSHAKVAPCPAGPISADSFRTYEALEAGTIPIADNISDAGDIGFWDFLMGSVPFPTINNYEDLDGYIKDQLKEYPKNNSRVLAWWIRYKRYLKERLVRDVEELSGVQHRKPITVIIPVSPIKSHPSTEILAETISSIKTHLPDAEILITFDGVRKEQEHMRKKYEQFINRALFLCNGEWNAIPFIFEEHTHQAGMAKYILNEVKTPTILYVEQDTPLTPDYPIDFDFCVEQIISGYANMIRFHYEAQIPEPHKAMMIGSPENGLQKTVQWSQRPHIASTAFYERLLNTHFSDHAKCFIEDVLHGKMHNDFIQHGELGWNQWRVFIYHPDGVIKRSYTTDGRAGEKKYDETQVW